MKEKIKDQEKTYSRLQFQQEALYQHLERVQKDRDDVYEKFSGSVYEARAGFATKNLLAANLSLCVEVSRLNCCNNAESARCYNCYKRIFTTLFTPLNLNIFRQLFFRHQAYPAPPNPRAGFSEGFSTWGRCSRRVA